MRLKLIAYGLAFGTVLMLTSGSVLSEGPEKQESDYEKMMKAWQTYALPGKHHEKLEFYVGTWDVTTKFWMDGPDAPPTESTATSWCRMIFGGRFVQSEMKGMMTLEIEGQTVPFPMEAIGYLGYDNFKEKYVSIWIDSSGTGLYRSEGTVNETGKVFTYFSQWDEWETGRRDVPYKMTDTITDENTIVTEFHDLTAPAGKSLVMEMTSRRQVD